LAKKSSVAAEPLAGSRYVGCLGPFLPLRDLEFDGVTFCEALVPVGCDRTVVNKYIGPTIVTDKPKTLGIVKPFHSSFKAIHSLIPLPRMPDIVLPVTEHVKLIQRKEDKGILGNKLALARNVSMKAPVSSPCAGERERCF
jgi:hypothetical protein